MSLLFTADLQAFWDSVLSASSFAIETLGLHGYTIISGLYMDSGDLNSVYCFLFSKLFVYPLSYCLASALFRLI